MTFFSPRQSVQREKGKPLLPVRSRERNHSSASRRDSGSSFLSGEATAPVSFAAGASTVSQHSTVSDSVAHSDTRCVLSICLSSSCFSTKTNKKLSYRSSGGARNFRQGVRQSVAFLPIHPGSAALPSRPYQTRNSSGDEITNVNFYYDDIVHALENTIDSCINSATDRFLQRRFTKFSEITQCNGHYAVQGHSRSPVWVPIESSLYDLLLVINTNLPPILHRFQVMADYWSNFR